MKRVVFLSGWLCVVSLLPCGAATVEIDILTSFPIPLPAEVLAGDLAYSPTSHTLLVVPSHDFRYESPPAYWEVSTEGALIRSVVLPYEGLDPARTLLHHPLSGIEWDPTTSTLVVTQYGPVAGGDASQMPTPPYYNTNFVLIGTYAPEGDFRLLRTESFTDLEPAFCGVLVDSSSHTILSLMGDHYTVLDYDGNVLGETPCDVPVTLGLAHQPEEDVYFGVYKWVDALSISSGNLYPLGRLNLPPALLGARGITHGEGDIFWLSSADHIFKVRIRYSPPQDSWISY